MSLLVTNLGGGQTDAALSLQHFGSLLTGSGVLTPTSFTVSAQVAPDMTVQLSGSSNGDKLAIVTANGDTYFVKNTSNKNVTILANASGVTKTDAIVVYVDLTSGDPNNAGSPGAAKAIAVRRDGTNTGAPTTGEIDAATLNNPWLKLSHVEVVNGATEITSSNITNQRTMAKIDGAHLADGTVTGTKLSNSTTFGGSNNKLLNFVQRDCSALAAWDFNGAAAASGGWADLDLRPIVGSTAVRVRLYAEFGASDARAVLMFCKGQVNSGVAPANWTYNVQSIKAGTTAADSGSSGIIEVDLTTLQWIQRMYNAYGGTINIVRFNVIGWYEPASTA